MTDLQISKALALAIGWKKKNCIRWDLAPWGQSMAIRSPDAPNGYKSFDYRDWNVISPIAEKFNVFPYKADEKLYGGGWLTMHASRSYETPQKAIAMAVIRG